jgi:hypothetical protein
MIWKRLLVMAGTLALAAISGIMAVGAVIGMGYHMEELDLPVASVVLGLLTWVILALPLAVSSFLCGYLQPAGQTPWKSALLWSPFTWLPIFGIPTMLSETAKEPWQLPIGLLIFAALWATCAWGMILKRQKHEKMSEQEDGQRPSESALSDGSSS